MDILICIFEIGRCLCIIGAVGSFGWEISKFEIFFIKLKFCLQI